MSYQIKLEVFEGPLDLLLHLIKKNEVNIYDIPISIVTKQYLDYLDLMREFNLEIAGEFLLMAATLTYIKSKMLLPKEEKAGVDDMEEDDPRAELIRKLLEYKRFKEVAEDLGKREEIWRDVFYQGHDTLPETDEEKEETMVEVGIFELIDAFRDVLDRLPDNKSLEIIPEELTVRGKMTSIIERLDSEGTNGLTLWALLDNDSTKRSIVVTFLALLELAKMRLIRLLQVEDRETIRVFRSESGEEQVMDEL
ncbi:MAG: segregation/condensation protein A [Nitrospira sp.]|nr:segregation/condensation protein A [Nitrospira sp.]